MSCRQGGHTRRFGAGQQQAKAGPRPAADPTAELVKLRQAEAVGVLDDHHGGLGDVKADLDERGRHQNGDFAGAETP